MRALRSFTDEARLEKPKDALAGVLWDVTSEYDVPLMVSRGMPSLTFLYAFARAIRRAAEKGKDTYIYQFGDHDPSGVLIPKTIERRLHQMCEALDCPPPYVERIALTEEQIEDFDLPTADGNGNPHANSFAGDSTELDALHPRDLRALVREVIERHIGAEALEHLRAAEESERELLRAWRPGGRAVSRQFRATVHKGRNGREKGIPESGNAQREHNRDGREGDQNFRGGGHD